MAEFCLECLSRLDGRHYNKTDFVLSDDLDFCEGCGQWKHIVVVRRPRSLLATLGLLLKQFILSLWRKYLKK